VLQGTQRSQATMMLVKHRTNGRRRKIIHQ
jgi:hypothetical protein